MQEQAKRKIAAQSEKKVTTKDSVKKLDKIALAKRQELGTASESNRTDNKSKYGNKRCTVNGVAFDSKKEMYRYLELKGMQDAGLITELKLQHHFTLSEAFRTAGGETVRRVEYIADFTYFDSEGKFTVEDVKSEATRKNPVYSIKKRLMASMGYMITEV